MTIVDKNHRASQAVSVADYGVTKLWNQVAVTSTISAYAEAISTMKLDIETLSQVPAISTLAICPEAFSAVESIVTRLNQQEAVSLMTPHVYAISAADCSVTKSILENSTLLSAAIAEPASLKNYGILAEFVKTESAIGSVLERLEKYNPVTRARAELESTRELLSHAVSNAKDLSSKDFWSVYTAVTKEKTPYIIDGQKRLSAIVDHAALRSHPSDEVSVENSISARARTALLRTLDEHFYYFTGNADLFLSEFKALFVEAVRAVVKVTIRFRRLIKLLSIPSTEYWVRSFMLWTGISPPLAVTKQNCSRSAKSTGEFRAYPRSTSARHHRTKFDGRAPSFNGEGRASLRLPSACCSYSRRCDGVFHAKQHGRWPLYHRG